jgi:HK97 family phage prohead protease
MDNRVELRAPALKYAKVPFASVETEEGTFSGYASLFGRVDLGNDRVAKGAFQKALKRRGAKGVRMLFQHDPNEVIGSWLDIQEDEAGLFVKGRINRNIKRGAEVLELIRDGAIDGLSIGFKTVRATKDPSAGIRTIHEADLWEISIVTFPMLPEARVSEVKTGTALPSIRTFEHWLTRDAGLSRSQARRVIAKGYAGLIRERDAAPLSTAPTLPAGLVTRIRQAVALLQH